MASRKISQVSMKGHHHHQNDKESTPPRGNSLTSGEDLSGGGGGSRFQVDKVDGEHQVQSRRESYDIHPSQLTYVYDTKNARSFGQMTREALPKADNYLQRNLNSIHDGPKARPTLEELIYPTYMHEKDKRPSTSKPKDSEPTPALKGKVVKFSWLEGVLMRCLLNIWGVMLFLRLSWCIGNTGLLEGLIMMSAANLVTFITAFSMSAVATNGQISGGGIYYMISRSLGPEFGAAIGLMFTIANSVAVSLHTIGFCESVNDLLAQYNWGPILDGEDNSIRVVGAATLVAILILAFIGMDWVTRAQMLFLVILIAAQVDFIVGSFIGPVDNEERAKGFIGYDSKTFKTNFWNDYRTAYGGGDQQQDFFSVFGVFFPSVTGIVAGANLSGDLKDPAGAIPKGTLLAIAITYVTYIIYAIMLSGAALRETTGNVTQYEMTMNESIPRPPDFLPYDYCEKGVQECEWGLLNSAQVMELISSWGPLIYMGCFAATLSSAVASLVGAPRVLQALAKDKIYPLLHFFSSGYGANNDPIRGYLLVFAIALGCILIAKLNAIAPIQANFFLMAYCLINFSCFHASITRSPGFRPSFKYYNAWVSLAGAVMCIVVMFLMSWIMALVTVGVVAFLYLFVSYRKPEVNWGSSTQAQSYNSALKSVSDLVRVEEHVKNYRPQLLVFSGALGARPALLDFAHLVSKNLSLLVCAHVVPNQINHKIRQALTSQAYSWLQRHKIRGFYNISGNSNFTEGGKSLMELSGLGKLRPNMILLGYKGDWTKGDNKQSLQEYFDLMCESLQMHLAVGILRVKGGLDYTGLITEDGQKSAQQILTEMNLATSPTVRPQLSSDNLSEDNISDDEGRNPNEGQTSAISTPDVTLKMSENKKEKKKDKNKKEFLYTDVNAAPLSNDMLTNVDQFRIKQKRGGTIDVWWLYDDGGLTLLVPYILSTRHQFQGSTLRVFTLANKRGDDLAEERRNLAALLSKFRINYSSVTVIPGIQTKAKDSTKKEFEDIIEPFTAKQNTDGMTITPAELMAFKERTNRHLRLSEELKEHSKDANVVVMTLPIPRKGTVSAPLYMAWLEIMTRDMPPFLFIRGNQTSVLTFYS